jgi:hypothetical protein
MTEEVVVDLQILDLVEHLVLAVYHRDHHQHHLVVAEVAVEEVEEEEVTKFNINFV